MGIAKDVALVVALAAQVGCGSKSGSRTVPCDGGCPQVTPADEAFVTSLCTALESCCVVNAFRAAPDVAGCKAQAAKQGFSRDPALRSACLSELQGLASAGAACFPDLGNFADACNRIYYEPNGTRQPGEPCTVRADCAGMAGFISLCVGTCMRVAPGKAGDAPCLGASKDGVIIAAPYSVSNSTPPISTGVICDRRAGLYCTFTQGLAMQSCQPLAASGTACSTSSSTCASGLCYQTTGAQSGTCVTLVSAGQTCQDVATNAQCDEASYCDSGVCVSRSPAGSTCAGDTICSSDTCTGGRCATNPSIVAFGYCGHG